MQARVAGSGAVAHLAGDSVATRLYRGSDGSSYTRFEISAEPSRLLQPGWPFGGFDTYVVRLFAEPAGACQVERIHVRYAAEGDPDAGFVLSRGLAWSGDEHGGYAASSPFCTEPIDVLDRRLW
jgi:hypothetical protein